MRNATDMSLEDIAREVSEVSDRLISLAVKIDGLKTNETRERCRFDELLNALKVREKK